MHPDGNTDADNALPIDTPSLFTASTWSLLMLESANISFHFRIAAPSVKPERHQILTSSRRWILQCKMVMPPLTYNIFLHCSAVSVSTVNVIELTTFKRKQETLIPWTFMHEEVHKIILTQGSFATCVLVTYTTCFVLLQPAEIPSRGFVSTPRRGAPINNQPVTVTASWE